MLIFWNTVLKVLHSRQLLEIIHRDHPFSTYVKIFGKTNISYPLTHALTRTYQGVRNISFSKNFAYALNERSRKIYFTVPWLVFQLVGNDKAVDSDFKLMILSKLHVLKQSNLREKHDKLNLKVTKFRSISCAHNRSSLSDFCMRENWDHIFTVLRIYSIRILCYLGYA